MAKSYYTIKSNPDKKKTRFGYNELKLRSAIAMAGVRNVGNFVAKVTGYHTTTAYDRLKDGLFTRADIANLIEALRLTEEQTFEIFFSGLEPRYTDEDRRGHRPWWSDDEARIRHIPDSVADKLDEAMEFEKEHSDDKME